MLDDDIQIMVAILELVLSTFDFLVSDTYCFMALCIIEIDTHYLLVLS